MIALKIQCNCGQKIAFDVTPANDKVPFVVSCPLCGVDATSEANKALGLKLVEIANAPAVRIQGMPAVSMAPLPAPLPAPIPTAPAHAGRPAPGMGRPMAGAAAAPRVAKKRGNDGWSSDETALNKLGTQLVVACSIVAALLAWHIFGVHVSPTILGAAVAVCGVVGGIMNIYGRGPIWAGAIIGFAIAVGGYATVEWWIRSRESVWSLELTLAFCVGTLPGFGLQFGLQRMLRKKE